MRWLFVPILLALFASLPVPLPAATFEQVISRENPAFQPASARMTVGRDGNVYLCSGRDPSSVLSYVVRVGRDGSNKVGAAIVYAALNATANADGVIASANAHFARKISLCDRDFTSLGSVGDFLANDAVGWSAPAHVEAGPSGDFYGADQHRDRIVRLRAAGKTVTAYPIPREPAGAGGQIDDFRVCEKTQAFYILTRAPALRCVGFDGTVRWTQPAALRWRAGGFDVDDNGVLYLIEQRGDTVHKVSPEGKLVGVLKLQSGDRKPKPGEPEFTDLRVFGGEVLLKRKHETELFQRYDLTTGDRKCVVLSDHERLIVTFPRDVWTAGEAVPFQVSLAAGGKTLTPRWHVWACRVGDLEYRDWSLKDGEVHVPVDAAGIYQIKVTPEVRPGRGGTAPEYEVRAHVQVRRAGSKGTVSIWTPDNRIFYGRGEDIPFSVVMRADTYESVPLTVRLVDGQRTLAEAHFRARALALFSLVVPARLTSSLRAGRYALTVAEGELSCVPQPLEIGPGVSRPRFHTVQYGDYAPLYPSPRFGDAVDVTASRATRAAMLGMNLVVDRLGTQLGSLSWAAQETKEMNALVRRLEADRQAAAPEKATLAPPLLQTQAAYSALGIEQMAILMNNDAGLPLGTGFDQRKPAELTAALTRVTDALKPYRSFRGWSWAANWWVFGNRGANAAKTPEEKAAYEAALKHARDAGAWDPVLDRVSDYRLSYAVEAERLFNGTLRRLAPSLTTAVACPHRNVEAYPPVTLSNVSEVDLQAQWEQIALPYAAPHGVDFYKRPGKPAWTHPEVWNDAGTGEQIIPTLFQAIMRGVDGVGCSGPIPPWGNLPEDSRSSYHGTASVYRAFNCIPRQYGPWLRTLENNDAVAIIVSRRMLSTDEWRNVTGTYFARVMEAYATCLHAHTPARHIFVEDLKPNLLDQFKAVLVIGQTVELEPDWVQALKAAQAHGVAVFHDGTCRATLVGNFNPLGISFDHFEKDPSPASDDAAYVRFPAYCRANAPAVARALERATVASAAVDNDEILLSERRADEGRYLFVVNNATPALDPGQLWRVTLFSASRVPLQVPVRLPHGVPAVYDVFAGKRASPEREAGAQRVVQADCRSLPARLFALLPAAISRVEVRGPAAVEAGQMFAWAAEVQDENGKPIRASIPVRLRLLSADEQMLDEQYTAADSSGARGTLWAPRNAPSDALIMEATELFSGISARLPVKLQAQTRPVILTARSSLRAVPAAASTTKATGTAAAKWTPAEQSFGPHLRDVAVTADGSLAVLNAMNWDHNLYAVDTATGQLRWRQRLGHYFAFAPQGLTNGFAAQGFDFHSAEGYHLYLGRKDGTAERRFTLYGLPGRLPHRLVPGILNDRVNNFAIAEDSRWVAAAGDLGLAVWDRGGQLLWSSDWWKTRRHTVTLTALGREALLVVDGMIASAYAAMTGQMLWQLPLTTNGEVLAVQATRDGRTCAVLATTEGGRVYVLYEGKLVRTLATPGADTLVVSPDGSHLAVVAGQHLSCYSVADGLQWILPGDGSLHSPRFAADSGRIAVSTDLGTVYVVNREGKIVLDRDCGALAIPAWLPDGDLLLATWMGQVCRLDATYAERWRTRLEPAANDMRGKLLADDGVPTTRFPSWGNAEPLPDPLAPNLLDPSNVLIKFRLEGAPFGQSLMSALPALVDGKANPPPTPWLPWTAVGWLAGGNPFAAIVLDTFRTQMRVTGITLVEDAAHPESWLRDARLESWDAATEQWRPVQPLLSNAAVHTHRFAQPVEAARFRIIPARMLVGNLRLAQIVLHGEKVGPSHPDVRAKRPVAVLFDEGDDLKDSLIGVAFRFDGAFSGGRCLTIPADSYACPSFQPPFGHTIPNWDFEIVEKPNAGQYRYLQFAWRALSPATRGVTLRLDGDAYGRSLSCYAGEFKREDGTILKKMAEVPPQTWQVGRIDLWEVFKNPTRIRGLRLASPGGPAAFDQIVLGRTESDLPAAKK